MHDPVRVFVGMDERQPLAYNVLQASLHRHASRRVQVEPLLLRHLPIKRRGLTDFTYSRFLVPWICDYKGPAIFMDADIVVTGDIAELADATNSATAVQVMKNQKKFEWASVMLFNCENCAVLTPEFVDDPQNKLLDLEWGVVGNLPEEWNHCVGYQEPKTAKLYHFTQGIPCWPETRGNAEDAVWDDAARYMKSTVSWSELMLHSVHAKPVLKRVLAQYEIGLA
jgi:hypothetical protein